MSGKLELIIGPMFSGKSTLLIKKIRIMIQNNLNVLVLKPQIDNRYSDNNITSHNMDMEACYVTTNLMDINKKYDINNFDCIVIDEGQFIPDLKEYVLLWLEKYNKHIIVGGLDGDFKRDPIGEILLLIPYADEIHKLKSDCSDCKNINNTALFTYRLVKSDDVILIGGNDMYIPLCREHYIKYKNIDNNSYKNTNL